MICAIVYSKRFETIFFKNWLAVPPLKQALIEDVAFFHHSLVSVEIEALTQHKVWTTACNLSFSLAYEVSSATVGLFAPSRRGAYP